MRLNRTSREIGLVTVPSHSRHVLLFHNQQGVSNPPSENAAHLENDLIMLYLSRLSFRFWFFGVSALRPAHEGLVEVQKLRHHLCPIAGSTAITSHISYTG